MGLFLDFETRSEAEIGVVGSWKYCQHPTTVVLYAGTAVDDEPAEVTDMMGLLEKLRRADRIISHNAHFEWAVLNYTLGIEVPIEKFHCTLSMAAQVGLPLALDKLCEALGLPGKDALGYAAMLKECKPRAPRKGEDPTQVHYYNSPKNFELIREYCKKDVELERRIFRALPPLPEKERKLWLLDFEINKRGIPVDVPSVKILLDVVEKRRIEKEKDFSALTKGAVDSPTCYLELAAWVGNRLGRKVPSVGKKEVEELLAGYLPEDVREVLLIKKELGKSSVAKYAAMLNKENAGRVQGSFQYHGSHTGRWAGRGIQPQNFPSDCYEEEDYENVVGFIGKEDISFFYGDPFFAASRCLRGTIKASGVFYCADFSAIESRGLAYLAGETWLLDSYRSGIDVYTLTAAQILGKPISKITKEERKNPGKIAVLACGYQGGPAATRKFGAKGTDEELRKKIVDPWRDANPASVKFWYDIERAVVKSIQNPWGTFFVKKISIRRTINFLCIKLPSGRIMYYYKPELQEHGGKKEIVYWGKILGGGFAKITSYGGKFVENIVSGHCRDILAGAIVRVEKAGYPVVAHSHDEVLCEVETGKGDLEEFIHLVEEVPPYAEGMPIKAEGWTGRRYRK